MRIKVPNQHDGEIVVTTHDLERHVFSVNGDGTIEVNNEAVAAHLLTTMEGAVRVGTDVANQTPEPPVQPDLDPTLDPEHDHTPEV